jgi:MFS-type transporter involved in bile tolerance (Atg22 family)
MGQPDDKGKNHRKAFNLTIIGIFGQVGFLTLFIIVVALLGGLWLDRTFDSKPLFTVILMIASVPVSLVLMYKIVMWATSRIKPPEKKTHTAEEDLDRD